VEEVKEIRARHVILGTVPHIRCFAATGCREHEESPPVEDEIRIEL
jgi:hypothetical protein